MRDFSMFDEKIHEFTHDSGLKVQILPKKGFRRKYAFLTVKFGSTDIEYLYDGQKKELPYGTAHFLEHKMFEKKNEDIFDKYSKTGANCNAFTSRVMTSYQFDCIDHFEDNLDILLELVFEPYFTEENVEKEKGIIIQEINMYLDNPYCVNNQEFFNLLYHDNSIKADIAGTAETVNKITPDILYNCHKAFYRPDNMYLTIIGDVSEKTIKESLDKMDFSCKSYKSVERIIHEEPIEVFGLRSVRQMEINTPIFSFGFKDKPIKHSVSELLKRSITGEIASGLLFSGISELRESLYRSGDIQYIYSSYTNDDKLAYFMISGESCAPEKVEKAVREYIVNIAEKGVDSQMFQSIKKSEYGNQIRCFDNPSLLAWLLVAFKYVGFNIFDYFDAYDKITEEEVNEFIRELANKEMVVSIIEPKGRENL